jgi:hypothetical protein
MRTKQKFKTVADAEDFLRRAGYTHQEQHANQQFWERASWTAVIEVTKNRVTVDYI